MPAMKTNRPDVRQYSQERYDTHHTTVFPGNGGGDQRNCGVGRFIFFRLTGCVARTA
jgi:hypothetical protein